MRADAEDAGCRVAPFPGVERSPGAIGRIVIPSPVGRLVLEADPDALRAVGWAVSGDRDEATPETSALLREARDQIDAYFARRLRRFTLPLRRKGTPFQNTVWDHIAAIPYGATFRYLDVAVMAATGPRAVARACAANRLPLVVPCHRVVGASSDGGYSAGEGLTTKRFLLRLEAFAARR